MTKAASHTVIGVAPPGEPAGDREPLEDGAVSEAQDACLESGGCAAASQESADRVAALSGLLMQDGREWSGVAQFDDLGLTVAVQVVTPSLHHDRAPVIKICSHVAPFHARWEMT